MITVRVILITLLLYAGAVSTVFASGAGNPPGGSGDSLTNPLGSCEDFNCIAARLLGFLYAVSLPIVAIVIIVGGFQMLTAGGNEKRYETGKKTVLYAVIGFAVIVISGGVVDIIRSLF